MVRKRARWTRVYAKRKRPKTKAPTNGWLLTELTELTCLPTTTVQYYLRKHLIRPLELRGTITRYGRRQLMLLLGMARLRADDESTLAQKKRKLDAMSDAALERWLRDGPLPAAAAAALGFAEVPAVAARVASRPSSSVTRDTDSSESTALAASSTVTLGKPTVERWERIELLPGLDLMLRADAQTTTRAVAQRIWDEFASK